MLPTGAKSREAGKGVQGRASKWHSIAVLTANRQPVSFGLLTLGHTFGVRVHRIQRVQRVVVAADAADYKKPAAPSVISTEAKRSGEISPSDGTGGITAGDLSTQSIIKALSICPHSGTQPRSR